MALNIKNHSIEYIGDNKYLATYKKKQVIINNIAMRDYELINVLISATIIVVGIIALGPECKMTLELDSLLIECEAESI